VNAATRDEHIRAELELCGDALRAAEALLGLGLPNDAVSRAYYAAFHAARALLMTAGLEPKTHRGVMALLNERFVEIGEEQLSSFARLQTFRAIADYDARARLSASRASAEVASARSFVERSRIALDEALRGAGS
jgi:hypothetical protein